MFVKCINNEGNKRLRIGEFYEVNIKILGEKSFSLVNMPGKYSVDRFQTTDNKPFTKDDQYYNHRYNPNNFNEHCGYVSPNKNKISMLEDSLYKIEDVKMGYEYNSSTQKTRKVYKRIKIEGYKRWFNSNSFFYYSDDEAMKILRNKKLEQIKNKVDNE